ncbi:ferric-dicitrate binding protein FerR, regulates iron transport through sigma-19 [Chitinophaga eiseniae]|uniref:Ferric-dicitrate binding protein FerR, regulates iron transport through sigma-19 n=1 Tax=Chitinophaga eiseniae TaxID=634771 RepID=A0A1T4T601_9BACT|nr:FecR domain-containing protein [Chitinophaga eiseniae]SKA35872.1 ferric-dicitrate binding protein FerR, regulates iron transport through sigma-19 [Chitinophaga eiseniae]
MALSDEEINELITSFLSGEASPGEAIILENWKRARPENQELFEKISLIWQKIDGEIYAPLPASAAWEKIKTVRKLQKQRRQNLRLLIRIAAMVVIVITCTHFIMRYSVQPPKEQPQLCLYSIDALHKDTLPDKSVVEMDAGASLQYYETANRRRVVVKGRSWFQVKRISKQPFEVEAGSLTIKVLGTTFQVVNEKNDQHVSVTCGSVLVTSPRDSVVLKAGQSAMYLTTTGELRLYEKTELPVPAANPRQFHFVNSTLADICRQLADVYGTKIILADSTLQQLTMSADFRNESLDNIMNVVSATLSIQYHHSNDSIILNAKRTH